MKVKYVKGEGDWRSLFYLEGDEKTQTALPQEDTIQETQGDSMQSQVEGATH